MRGQQMTANNILYGDAGVRGKNQQQTTGGCLRLELGSSVRINWPHSSPSTAAWHNQTGVITAKTSDDKWTVDIGKIQADFDTTEIIPLSANLKGGDPVDTPDGSGVFQCIEDGGDGSVIFNVVLDDDPTQIAHEYNWNEIEKF